MISKFDFGWLVGILEGEGCFTLNGSAINKQPMILIQSTDGDVVTRTANILGGNGFVFGRARKGDTYGKKIMYRYGVGGILSIYWMRILRNYMGKRRQNRINEIIKFYESMPRRKSNVLPPIIEGINNVVPSIVKEISSAEITEPNRKFFNPFLKEDIAS